MPKFQKDLGGTTACTERLLIVTKGCGQLTSNDTYFSDSWFGSVKTADEVMTEGVDYYLPVKTIYKGFCLATLENLVKDCPGGSYLVIKSDTRVPGSIPLLVIGYK